MVKIFTGKDVDEATGAALLEIGVELEDLDIKVINPGRSGILGFGGEHLSQALIARNEMWEYIDPLIDERSNNKGSC